jgi:hypothetical protein
MVLHDADLKGKVTDHSQGSFEAMNYIITFVYFNEFACPDIALWKLRSHIFAVKKSLRFLRTSEHDFGNILGNNLFRDSSDKILYVKSVKNMSLRISHTSW